MSESDWFTEEESFDLLTRMFPAGLHSADVHAALCPEGWEESPLSLLFKGGQETDPEKSDTANLGYLVGLCLWDILSDNHDLILPDGRVAHLGSFRATAGILSDFFVGESSRDFGSGEDYLEFYLGTWAIKNRKLLKPVYQDIFSRLRACGVDWKYSFPRLFVVRFKRHEDQANENLENYDPSASFAAEQNEREEDKEFARTEDQLDQLYRDSVERARSEPPPQTVQAYFEVFGKWPLGWPPWSTL